MSDIVPSSSTDPQLETQSDDNGKAVSTNPKQFRKRRVSEEEDHDEESPKRRSVKSRITFISDDELETERDQIERQQIEENFRHRDAAAAQGTLNPNETPKEEKEEDVSIQHLRKVSRHEYLKKREQKKLKELIDDIQDEQYLFDGVTLTESENRNFTHKKKIYDLLSNKYDTSDHLDEYRMPDAYDQDGAIDQKTRFATAMQRYRDSPENTKNNEQQAWEDRQIRKTTGLKKPEQDDYDYVFEHQIDFIKAVTGGEEDDDFIEAVSKPQQLQDEDDRKKLPIYQYREELLQAIKDHQVLIIVGETGSGKTTQIPQYLHESGYTTRGKIACTQPRRVAAMSVASRVAQEIGVKLGHEVGYSIRFEDCTSDKTVVKYMTDGMLLREFLREGNLASYSVVMIDEAHERTISTDVLFTLVKDLARDRPDLKLLISSATLDAEKFSDFFDSAPIFKIPGRRYPVEINYTRAPEANYIDAAIVTVFQIHVTESPGDILVFLTGQDEIEAMEENLKHRLRTGGFGSNIGELIICPIYANLPTELQSKIFDPTPEGARKVVLATNIAETSVTIDGIKYVIDPGFAKMKSFNPRTGMESLLVAPISKASANQRAGRAGRTGPGVCYRLYTAHSYQSELEDNTIPEILRTNVANVVLLLQCLGIKNLYEFDFMDRPPEKALIKALELLYALGAMNKIGDLTKTGRRMAEFPVDPMLSKMIVASEKYKCSDEVISIASMLSIGNSVFYRPKDKRVHADNAHFNFYSGNVGDHVALLNVFNSWREANYSTQWCYENYVQFRSMKRARDIRDQLVGLLDRVEIELTSNINDLDSIKKAVVAGFFANSARLHKSGAYRTVKNPQTVYIHPSSGIAKEVPRWVIYHELVLTTKEYMRQVTEVKPGWLLEVAPHFFPREEVEDTIGSKKMPRVEGRPGCK